jgi:hypothetical protein
MKRKIAVTPAIRYSIFNPSLQALQALSRLGKAPHQDEEHDHDSDIKKIQHDFTS